MARRGRGGGEGSLNGKKGEDTFRVSGSCSCDTFPPRRKIYTILVPRI